MEASENQVLGCIERPGSYDVWPRLVAVWLLEWPVNQATGHRVKAASPTSFRTLIYGFDRALNKSSARAVSDFKAILYAGDN